MKLAEWDWRKLFGVPLYSLANCSRAGRVGLAFRAVASLLMKRLNEPDRTKDAILFVNSTARSDYRGIVACSYTACRQAKILWNVEYRVAPNVPGALLFLRHFGDLRTIRRAAGQDLIGSLVLYVAWVKCIQFGQIVDTLAYEAVVVAADMQLLESFLVQRANRANVPTATCQHGLYIDNGGLVENDIINPINYLNCTSRYFLAWGERTQALMEKYTSTRCVIVGNPALPRAKGRSPRPYFYVLTDSDLLFRRYNERLLAIARETSERAKLPFFVRFHPDNDTASYGRFDLGSEQHPLSDANFAIGHVTSQMYVAMRSGVPVYRLVSPEPNHDLPDPFRFSTVDDLLGKTLPSEAFVELGRTFIAYTGEASAERYADFFDRLVTRDTDRNAEPRVLSSTVEPNG